MIENTDRKNVYDGNGLNDLWPFTFEISTDDGSDIAVYLTDDTGKTSGRLTSGYSVDVINKRVKYPAPAGTILPVGWKITLARETSLTQITSLTTQNFDPKSVEVALDKLTMAMQEAREIIDRALVADITVPAGTKYSLPAPNPGKAWGWNEEGTGVANYDNPAVAAAAAKLSADEAATSAAQSGYYATQAANSALQAGTVVDYEGDEPPVVTKPLLKWHKPSVHTIYLRNLGDNGWIEFMDSETGAVKEVIHAVNSDMTKTGPDSSLGFYYPLYDGPNAGGSLMWITSYDDTEKDRWLIIAPPNSGADRSYSALDLVPTDAKAVRLYLSASILSGTTVGNVITCKAAKINTEESIGPFLEVVRQSSAPNTNSRYIDVKIDHLKRFWFYWNHNLANGTGRVELHLEGYYK